MLHELPLADHQRDPFAGHLDGVSMAELGHADLGVTSAYLRGIDNTEIIHAVHERPAPMITATTGLSLRA